MVSPKEVYEGIADLRGIESFQKRENYGLSNQNPLKIRALANKHRGAVFYEVRLTLPQASQIEILISESKFLDAWAKLIECTNGQIVVPRKHMDNLSDIKKR